MMKIEHTYSIAILFFAIIWMPLMFIYGFFTNFLNINGELFVIIASISAIFFFVYLFIFIPLSTYYGKKYMSKYPENPGFKDNASHHSIILINSPNPDDSLPCGLSVLIKALLKKNCNFKLYNCYNVNDVKEVLKNKYASDIWIFGHGWRGGVVFKRKRTLKDIIKHENKGELLIYNDLIQEIDEYSKKRFIAQLHCNNLSKKMSNQNLPEILLEKPNDNNYFISSYKLDPVSIYLTLKFRLVKRIKCTELSK